MWSEVFFVEFWIVLDSFRELDLATCLQEKQAEIYVLQLIKSNSMSICPSVRKACQ